MSCQKNSFTWVVDLCSSFSGTMGYWLHALIGRWPYVFNENNLHISGFYYNNIYNNNANDWHLYLVGYILGASVMLTERLGNTVAVEVCVPSTSSA